jgi:hypothetical protein
MYGIMIGNHLTVPTKMSITIATAANVIGGLKGAITDAS